MLHVVLHQPEIPPNTGNIIRLCANTGAQLHLIRPLGFVLDDRQLRRAGLDYHEHARVHIHDSLTSFCLQLAPQRIFACTTRGEKSYAETGFSAGDALLFGNEGHGLPDKILNSLPAEQRLYIPMRAGNRSLNLSNAVAIVLYEAWRQLGFV